MTDEQIHSLSRQAAAAVTDLVVDWVICQPLPVQAKLAALVAMTAALAGCAAAVLTVDEPDQGRAHNRQVAATFLAGVQDGFRRGTVN